MVNYLLRWLQNLFILAAVLIAMLIFVWIFYPGLLPMFSLTAQFTGQLADAFKLWPLLILLLLVYVMPRRRR